MTATILPLVGLVAAVVLSGFFSGSETGVYCLNQVRLRVASERNRPGARRLAALMRKPEDLVITMLLGTNVADYLVAAFLSALLLRRLGSEQLVETYATLIGAPLLLVFGGIVPKDWFRRESDRLMCALSRPLALCTNVARATGLVWLLRSLTLGLARWIDPEHPAAAADVLPRTRALRLLREGAARGGLSVLQRDLMERVVNISKTRVRRVMVRRERAAMVPRTTSRDDLLRIARMAHFSRLPVYDGNPRKVIGVLNVYDVLTDPESRPIETHVREAFRLGVQVSVAHALVRMQQARQAMAIIEDRRGDCVGILTIKDLVAQIIGDFEAW